MHELQAWCPCTTNAFSKYFGQTLLQVAPTFEINPLFSPLFHVRETFILGSISDIGSLASRLCNPYFVCVEHCHVALGWIFCFRFELDICYSS